MNNPLIFFLNTNGVLLLVFFALLLLYIDKKNREVFWHALMVFCITLVVCVLLKGLFLRPRPFEVLPIERNAGLTLLPSFPSGHAAIAFAVSTIVALHRTRIGVFLLVISTLIALGRVAAGVHYPSDIAFGILVGVMIALFFDTVHIKGLKKIKRHP